MPGRIVFTTPLGPATATPVFTPNGGTYVTSTTFTLSCATPGAQIYFIAGTGSVPNPTVQSVPYTGPVTVYNSATVKAIAVSNNRPPSSVASAVFTIETLAATPTFSPVGGTYPSAQTVTLACATAGASIYYTTDGSTPTTSSTLYSGGISVSANTTLKAIAAASGYLNSAVGTAVYVIATQAATPSATPPSGTYASSQTVALSCTTSGSSIYYTTDGSTPTISSTLYSGGVSVAASLTLKAIAAAPGYANSNVLTAAYTIGSPASAFLSYAATLKSQGKVLIGQHQQYFEGPGGNTTTKLESYTSVTPLYALTGQMNAIIGVTANWYGTGGDPYNNSGGGQPSLNVVSQIIADWCATGSNTSKPQGGAGLVQMNWGQGSPVDGAVGPAISSANLASLVTVGSSLYNTLQTSTVALQTYLLAVVSANPNIVIMLRLFAELNGNYTWYGTQNSQTDVNNQILMQQQVWNTLFGGSGASLRSNVLINYNANNYGGYGPAAAWPGSAYADLAGYDMYSTNWTTSNPPVDPSVYTAFVNFGVPIIHCECGLSTPGSSNPTAYTVNTVSNLLIPNYLRAQEPACIGYVQWNDNGQYTPNGGNGNASMSICLQNDASTLLNESWAINLSKLPTF